MKQLMLGLVLGSVLTGGLVEAGGKLYGKDGSVQAPRGSIQSQDYFRQRQQWLDLRALRQNSDAAKHNPCGK